MTSVKIFNEERFLINPQKLKEGRIARGYSVSQLAEKIDVTRQAISKYESGTLKPSAITLRKISEILDLPFSFFAKQNENDKLNTGTIFFRSLKSAEARARDMIKIKAQWVNEIYEKLSKNFKLPSVNIPAFDHYSKNLEYTFNDIEEIAVELRTAWGIGLGPISNMTYLLEKNGFVISQLIVGSEKLDACSHIINGRPFIFLAKDKQAPIRSRFDLAHELGHIILHNSIEETELMEDKILERIEKEANRFASAFLFPKEKFLSELLCTSMNHFISLKSRWLISIKALIHRCGDLELINDSQRTYLYKQISIKKWNKKEPLDDQIQCETPTILKTCVNLLIDKGILTKNDLLDIFKFNPTDIEELCTLPENFLKSENPVIKIDFKKVDE